MREAASGSPGTQEPAASGETADDAPGSASPGIRDTLGRLAAAVASAVDTRVQLVALEFAEERERAKDRLALMLVAAVAATFALLAANTLLVVVLWDRLGWITLAGLAVVWGVVALVAVRRMAALAKREQRPFDGTLAEFARDRAWIAERIGRSDR
jgi:uncharacterized membrane protein YqjE